MPIPTSDIQSRVFKIASRVLRVPASELSGTSSPETVASWDSLLHMQLVLAIEEEFGVQFEAEEIVEMQRMDRILAIIKSKTD
jgi:acyl carrier protein